MERVFAAEREALWDIIMQQNHVLATIQRKSEFKIISFHISLRLHAALCLGVYLSYNDADIENNITFTQEDRTK